MSNLLFAQQDVKSQYFSLPRGLPKPKASMGKPQTMKQHQLPEDCATTRQPMYAYEAEMHALKASQNETCNDPVGDTVAVLVSMADKRAILIKTL